MNPGEAVQALLDNAADYRRRYRLTDNHRMVAKVPDAIYDQLLPDDLVEQASRQYLTIRRASDFDLKESE